MISKKAINHDTYEFELKFPNPDWTSGLFAGGHFKFHANIDGQAMTRPYTPITSVNEKGSAKFVIKIYRENPMYLGKGLFTKYLEN